MSKLTLPEFLRARIAEDGAEVVEWPTDGRWGLAAPGVIWMDPAGHPIYAPRARVLAECEAKRAIVESMGDDWVTRLLATVYADHPDYDEAWRP